MPRRGWRCWVWCRQLAPPRLQSATNRPARWRSTLPTTRCSRRCGAASTCPAGTVRTEASGRTWRSWRHSTRMGSATSGCRSTTRKLDGDGAEAYLDRMFEEVIFLLSLDYTVSLDLHAGNAIGGMLEADRQAGEDRLAALWRRDRGAGAVDRPAQAGGRSAERAGDRPRDMAGGGGADGGGDPRNPAASTRSSSDRRDRSGTRRSPAWRRSTMPM